MNLIDRCTVAELEINCCAVSDLGGVTRACPFARFSTYLSCYEPLDGSVIVSTVGHRTDVHVLFAGHEVISDGIEIGVLWDVTPYSGVKKAPTFRRYYVLQSSWWTLYNLKAEASVKLGTP